MSSFGGPEIPNDNLVLHLDAGNKKSYYWNSMTNNLNLTAGDFTKSAGLTLTTGQLAPDGSFTATTVSDTTTSYESLSRTFAVQVNSPITSGFYELSVFIKKTTGGTSPTTGFNITLTGGLDGTVSSFPRLNTDTGAVSTGSITPVGAAFNNVTSSVNNDYWKLTCYFQNSSNNTLLTINYYPVTGPYAASPSTATDLATTTGSQTIWGLSLIGPANEAGVSPYQSNFNTATGTISLPPFNSWYDLINASNKATLISWPRYSDSGGGSLAFDNTGEYASITKPNPNITGLISIELWIKFASAAGNVPIMKGSHFALNISSSTWQWADSSNYNFANFIQRTVSELYTVGQWTHLVITKDASFNVNLYKNGQLIDSRAAFGGNLTAVTSTMWLGGYSDTDTAPTSATFIGSLSVAKIYNAALSAEQVLQNFNALRGRYGV